MQFVKHLQCVRCAATYPAAPDATTCPACGDGGILDVVYDYAAIAGQVRREAVAASPERSLWRWLPLLPVLPDTPRPPLRAGGTPLYRAAVLGEALGVPSLWLKDEGQNPTGSLKDRASAVGVVKAQEAGRRVVCAASTGNAASSLAGACAALGLQAIIFVPHYAAQGKVAQLLMFGATVIAVEGTYLDAYEMSAWACQEFRLYTRNAAVNPYLVEGKKTCGLEVAEQLGWRAPEWLVMSVGDGCTIAAAYKAFTDLQALGWIDSTPKLLGVQAAGAKALYDAFNTRTRVLPGGEDTIADGISVAVPRNADKALHAIRASGGTMITVSDDEIRAAMRLTGARSGVFAEPAAAAAVAGLAAAAQRGIIGPEEEVVAAITGNGLKDVKNAIAAAGEPLRLPPDRAAVGRAVSAALEKKPRI